MADPEYSSGDEYSCADAVWRWSVSGIESSNSPGAMERAYEDSGDVTADVEGAAGALAWLLDHGPFWGVLDADAGMTIEIRPKGDARRG